MRLATSTNILGVNRDGSFTDTVECLQRCTEIGFRVYDMNFCFTARKDFVLLGDDWEKKIDEIGNTAAKLGVEFSQSHIPFYGALDPNLTDPVLYQRFEELCRRAYHASATLGAKWAVVHAFTAMNENCETSASKRKNIEYFSPYVELAKKLGVGIAIENMTDFYKSPVQRRYTGTYEDLCDLVDTFADDAVGVNWDFGHANIMHYDQCRALRYIGKRLKATHVDDNYGVKDVHLVPFLGEVKWEDIMKTLVEIGYQGDFTYEAHGFMDNLPMQFKTAAAKFMYDVGMYLISLAEAAK